MNRNEVLEFLLHNGAEAEEAVEFMQEEESEAPGFHAAYAAWFGSKEGEEAKAAHEALEANGNAFWATKSAAEVWVGYLSYWSHSVGRLFRALLGEGLNAGPALESLPLATECGEHCQAVLLGAAYLMLPWGFSEGRVTQRRALAALVRETLSMLYHG